MSGFEICKPGKSKYKLTLAKGKDQIVVMRQIVKSGTISFTPKNFKVFPPARPEAELEEEAKKNGKRE